MTGSGLPSDFWTANDSVLRERYAAGDSTAEIAAILGVSRNSVIGRASRLKLRHPNPRGRGKARVAKTATPRRPRKRKQRSALAAVLFEAARVDLGPEPEARIEGVLALPFRGACRWPTKGEGFSTVFCGSKTLEESPYCLHHALRASLSAEVRPLRPVERRPQSRFNPSFSVRPRA